MRYFLRNRGYTYVPPKHVAQTVVQTYKIKDLHPPRTRRVPNAGGMKHEGGRMGGILSPRKLC